jgi:hypothetical protein
MLALTLPNFCRNILGRFAKQLAILLLGFTFAFAPSFLPTGLIDTAHAASKKKKAEAGLKFIGKTLTNLEKAGRKAQKKRGIVGKAGGILKNSAKAGNKGVTAAKKGLNKVSRGTNKMISKSKVGRGLQKGYRKAGRWQNKQINKAFRKCRGKACNFGKKAVEFAAPL